MKAIIVGGGLGGLIAARRLLEIDAGADITLIERDEKLGGLLAGGFYGDEKIYYDTGTHIPQETGIQAVDTFLQSSVAPEDLILLPPPDGDLAGSVFNGRLQSNSHFPDLRSVEFSDVADSIKAHLMSANLTPIARSQALADQLRGRFGARYADDVMLPRLEKIYAVSREQLCGFALELPGATRVILDDFDAWLEEAHRSPNYKPAVGVPDQRKLPASFRHGRRSYYCRMHGSSAFINGAAKTLAAHGVKFRLGARIGKVETENNRILLSGPTGDVQVKYDVLILSAGLIPGAVLLGYDLKAFGFERPLSHRVLHMLLPEPVLTDCSYVYSMDGEGWYRMTNYAAFSGDRSDRRLTVEVLGNASGEPDALAENIRKNMYLRGLLSTECGNLVGHVNLQSGFPRPSIANFSNLSELRALVNSKLPKNVMVAGVATEKDIFFQNEVISKIYEALPQFVEANL